MGIRTARFIHLIGQYHLYQHQWFLAVVKQFKIFSFVDRSQMDIKTKSNGSTYYYYLYDPGAEQGDWDMQFLAIGRWKR